MSGDGGVGSSNEGLNTCAQGERGLCREVSIVDRQVLEMEHTNIIVWETGIDGWIMTFGVPVGRHDIIELVGVPLRVS